MIRSTAPEAAKSLLDGKLVSALRTATMTMEHQRNLADAAAMRYRVGGPLTDGLMAELGMTGAGAEAGDLPSAPTGHSHSIVRDHANHLNSL